MREELQKLNADVRRAVAEALCADLSLDEDDLRDIVRHEMRYEMEDSLLANEDELVKESVKESVKAEIYDEVAGEIRNKRGEELMEFYRNDEQLIAEVRSRLAAEIRDKAVSQLRSELREEVLEKLASEIRVDEFQMSLIKGKVAAEIYRELKASMLGGK